MIKSSKPASFSSGIMLSRMSMRSLGFGTHSSRRSMTFMEMLGRSEAQRQKGDELRMRAAPRHAFIPQLVKWIGQASFSASAELHNAICISGWHRSDEGRRAMGRGGL